MACANRMTVTACVVIPPCRPTAKVITVQPIPGDGAMLLPIHTAAHLLTSKDAFAIFSSPHCCSRPAFLHSQFEVVNNLGETLLLFSYSKGYPASSVPSN